MSRRSSYYLGQKKYVRVGSDCVLYHAYWSGNATDHSSYGNDGTVAGATFVENGLSWDGTDDKLTIANHASLNTVTERCVAAWVNLNSTGTYMMFLQKPVGGQFYDLFYVSVNNLGAYTNAGFMNSGTNFYTEDAWTFIAYTAKNFFPAEGPNGRKIEVNFYQNGEIYGDFAGNDSPPLYTATANDLIVGWFDGTNYPLRGIIGEWYLFNTSTPSTSISDIFNATKARYGL